VTRMSPKSAGDRRDADLLDGMFPNDLSATTPWSWSSDAAPRGLGCVLVACQIDDGTAWVIAPPAVSLQPDETDEMRKQWRIAQFRAGDAEQLVIAPGEHVPGSYQDVTIDDVRSVVPSDFHNWIAAVCDRQQALADGFGRQDPRVAPNEEHVRAASTRFAELAGATASRQRANDALEHAIVDVPDTVDEILVRAGRTQHALPRALRAASAGESKDRLEMAEHDVPFLLYREGDDRQRIVLLDGQSRLTIGRQMASDIPLPWDSAVSQVHAALERVGDEWTLVDDGSSRNGSFLNGERVHGRRKLKDGDVIRVGVTTIAYAVPSERQSSSSTARRARRGRGILGPRDGHDRLGILQTNLAVGARVVGARANQITPGHEPRAPQPRRRPVSVLPRAPRCLVGRVAELKLATNALAAREPLQIFGEPGLGKTALLRHIAHGPHEAFPDGVIYYRSRHESLDDLLMRIFEFLYDHESQVKPTASDLATDLADTQALILLDDVDLDREDLETLLLTVPQSVFVLASPERSLWSCGHAIGLCGLDDDAALALVEWHLKRPLVGHERSDFAALCRALDGHPLQLVKAAVQVSEHGALPRELALAHTEHGAPAPGPAAQTRTARIVDKLCALTGRPDRTTRLSTLSAGAETAWTTLTARFNPLLYGLCHSYRLSPSDADDVVQATWERLLQNIDRIDDPSSIGTWLATTARRESLRLLLRREPATETLPDEPGNLKLEAEMVAAERRLQRAVASLPERDQRLLALLVSKPPLPHHEISRLLAPTGSIGPTRVTGLLAASQLGVAALPFAPRVAQPPVLGHADESRST
jgi:RNA polymerase sigma factor (sigma-70 family)